MPSATHGLFSLAVEVRSSDDPQGEAVVASDVDEEPIRIAVTRV